MRNDGGIPCFVCHFDGLDRFGKGADLIELNENGIAAAELDSFLETPGVRDEEIVADELYFMAELFGHTLPAFPVLFIEAVFDGIDRVLAGQ